MYKGKFDSKNREQYVARKRSTEPEQDIPEVPEEEVPAEAPVSKAAPAPKQKKKKSRRKGNKVITTIFYAFYFLMILSFVVGMYFVREFLIGWLEDFQAAQPTVKSEEVFQDLFGDPDWAAIYAEAGLTDTEFEGQDAFVAYMEEVTSAGSLTYAETSAGLSGDHKYLIQLEGKTLGYFTLTDKAAEDAPIPDWQLNEVHISLTRSESVRVQKLDGHTAYVNGQSVADGYTIRITSTVAEEYLPEGTPGIRMICQEVDGLLVPPQVTILDADGNECAVTYDEETGMYTEQLPEAEAITSELEERAIKAGEAYSYYMVNRNTSLFPKYFASGTTTYRNITGMDRWQQTSKSAKITGQTVTDYVRYTDDLFSARVSMTMELTRKDDSIKKYPMDATLFFENRKAGWMVIAMTNVDVTEPTNEVRLTFINGETELSSALYPDDSTEVFSPSITAPEGQVFSGWAEKEISSDGTITMTVVYTCDESNKLIIPSGTRLEPKVLYALFEDANAVTEAVIPETGVLDTEEDMDVEGDEVVVDGADAEGEDMEVDGAEGEAESEE